MRKFRKHAGIDRGPARALARGRRMRRRRRRSAAIGGQRTRRRISPARSRSRARRRSSRSRRSSRRSSTRRARTSRSASTAREPATASSSSATARSTSPTPRARSRPTKSKACKKNGIEYMELEVALDGVTVMTNPENSGVTCLNSGDIYALFGPESDGFENWTDADSLADAGRRQRRVPRRAARDHRSRRGVGHLRRVHRAHRHRGHRHRAGVERGRCRGPAQGLPGLAERQRHHHGDGGLLERPRVRRLRLRRGGRRRREGDRGRRRRRMRRSLLRDDLRRLVSALALALHLRERRRRRTAEVTAYVDYYLGDEALATAGWPRRSDTSPCRPTVSRPPGRPGRRRPPDHRTSPLSGAGRAAPSGPSPGSTSEG